MADNENIQIAESLRSRFMTHISVHGAIDTNTLNSAASCPISVHTAEGGERTKSIASISSFSGLFAITPSQLLSSRTCFSQISLHALDSLAFALESILIKT
jgi:hypothetical protein